MKKSLFPLVAILMMLTSTTIFFNGCKLKNPTEGFKVLIKADAFTAPSEFRVYDAKFGAPPGFSSPIPVTVSGPGADYIYTSGGNRALTIFQGGINLSVRKGTVVTDAIPLQFNIEINAPGYLPVVYPVTLYNLDPVSQTINLVSFDNPPAGSASKTQSVPTDASGKTTAPISIKLDASATKTEELSINIDSGTQLKDKDGNPVNGNIEAKILHFTDETPESMKSFPGGTKVSSIKDVNGNTLPGGTFDPSGWVNINMSVGTTDVKTFSQPIKVNMEINGKNPKTNTDFKEGDLIETFSRSAGNAEWVKEATVTIVKNSISGKLEAPLLVNHLSDWGAGFLLDDCTSRFSFKVLVTASTVETNVIMRIYEKQTYQGVTSEFLVAQGTYPLEAADHSITHTILTNFTPTAGTEYRFKLEGDVEFDYTGIICGSFLNAGEGIPKNKLRCNIFLRCITGNAVILPERYRLYYIDEASYQNTIVPAQGSNPAHKIDPRDGTVGGVSWTETQVHYVNDQNPRNTLDIPKVDLQVGHKYRFSVYYNDGTKETREDYLTDVVSTEIINNKALDMVITLSTCPIH